MCDVENDLNVLQRPVAAKGRNTLAIIVIGMAGSGKTCYVKALIDKLKEAGKKVYSINLDPAMTIDIRESIKYRSVMKKYKLGPNGAIITCLNLFVTRFDKVLEILDRRCAKLDYIVIDTPGQIEVFNWSASGTVILESLASSFPTTVNYVIDTCRSQLPVTFMANMVYACSVMYKSRLPFIACFNKIGKAMSTCKHDDQMSTDMKYALNGWMITMHSTKQLCRMIPIWQGNQGEICTPDSLQIQCNGISAITGEGFEEHIKSLDECREEYKTSYLPWLEEARLRHFTEQMNKLKIQSNT
eukprot:XP_001609506.1 XPA-binding protein 1 [Babesia bovis T2Bo]